MTEVLSISSQPDGSAFFDPSPLRRTSSHTSLFLHGSSSYGRSSSTLKSNYPPPGVESRIPASLPSSAPSSPRVNPFGPSAQPSYISTPSSSLSLDDQCSRQDDDDDDDEDIIFPDYEARGRVQERAGLPRELEPISILSSWCPESKPPPPPTPGIASPTKRSRPALSPQHSSTEDDTAVKREPIAHVDYLSHNWAEEDIWASWRYIVSKRNHYGNGPRLENAVWRSWTKSKYQFKTIAPGQLNWEKDHDVTWLYGPLQTGLTFRQYHSARPASQLSRSNSFASKKPILKKRSLSEVMLQRSLISSTLVKQATDALRAQLPPRAVGERTILGGQTLSDLVTQPHPDRPGPHPITGDPFTHSWASSSGAQTPCTKRHIHFNNKVEQCIAINKGGDDRDEEDGAIHDDSSSEDEHLTMKPIHRSKPRWSHPGTPRNSFSGESKTIAMLPSTTLNYRGDTPEPAEDKSQPRGSFWHAASKISPCPSQRTITPDNCSANFLLDDEDEDADLDWQPTLARRSSLHLPHPPCPLTDHGYDSDEVHRDGLRRTSSGMFMPYEEGEAEEEDQSFASSGLVGKVVNTVNTAKDIVHVIWNVGWRR